MAREKKPSAIGLFILTVRLSPLYSIIDFSCFAAKPDPIMAVARYAEELIEGGATLIQLRDKSQPEQPRRFLSCARELRRITLDKATLIVNDRVDICLAAEADGVHLGQDDLSPESARRIFDSISGTPKLWVPHPFASNPPQSPEASSERVGEQTAVATRKELLIGFSTHNLAQIIAADSLPIDYIAIGPVFATGSKANPDPVIGLEGVRQARQATKKPLVAIGGITRQNCSQVKAAGADAVAVISDLLESPAKAVADFLRVLG
ncbi:MAG TPA: thiamine phosphate synthase [Terriglobales bacterium]|jgi:thiamine-phosphate pyrophosphorylase|nr:thiamine phosphate synthase [Terriglobales bacterium]